MKSKVIIVAIIGSVSFGFAYAKLRGYESPSYNQLQVFEVDSRAPSYATNVLGGVGKVNLMRRFRDEVLASNAQGKKYIELFYQLFPDAVLAMIKDARCQAPDEGCRSELRTSY